jgi:thiol-disulfide isomerase/thioredoxin
MKVLALFTLTVLGAMQLQAQSQYEVTNDASGKILKGVITKELIAADSSFKWYKQNTIGYTPQADAVTALKSNGNDLQIIAFGGTWCDDTRFILPKFFSILDAAGFAQEKLTLIGVDRSKKTIGHLAEALNVVNVPTFIVLRDGKELGRVVEYGKTGQWEKELADIIGSK